MSFDPALPTSRTPRIGSSWRSVATDDVSFWTADGSLAGDLAIGERSTCAGDCDSDELQEKANDGARVYVVDEQIDGTSDRPTDLTIKPRKSSPRELQLAFPCESATLFSPGGSVQHVVQIPVDPGTAESTSSSDPTHDPPHAWSTAETPARHAISSSRSTSSVITSETDETPFPSRILHLFPRLSVITPVRPSSMPSSTSFSFGLRFSLTHTASVLSPVRAHPAENAEFRTRGDIREDAVAENDHWRTAWENWVPGLAGSDNAPIASRVIRETCLVAGQALARLTRPSLDGMLVWANVFRDISSSMADAIRRSAVQISAFTIQDTLNPAIVRLLTVSTSLPPGPATQATKPNEGATRSSAHLYSHETLYTLRMPIQQALRAGHASRTLDDEIIDIGPTVKPVWVKKRAALPVYESNSRKTGWGREMEWRYGM